MSLPKSPNNCVLQEHKRGEHVHSFFVIIILESNKTSVNSTIHNSNTDIVVVANLVKIGSSSN